MQKENVQIIAEEISRMSRPLTKVNFSGTRENSAILTTRS